MVSINREVKVDEGNKENDQRNDREVNVETEERKASGVNLRAQAGM